MKHQFTVGQKLYWVYNDSRMGQPGFVTVESIGRKWIGISNRRRISAETLAHDGGDYPSRGRCFFTKEEHDAIVERTRAWDKLREMLARAYIAPSYLHTANILAAIALLSPRDPEHPGDEE